MKNLYNKIEVGSVITVKKPRNTLEPPRWVTPMNGLEGKELVVLYINNDLKCTILNGDGTIQWRYNCKWVVSVRKLTLFDVIGKEWLRGYVRY